MAKTQNTAAVAESIARPLLAQLGLSLWDVGYEKEGSQWYLRYYIDKEQGLTIEDCEAFSRAVEKLLDEADPIEGSYVLEVSSPGLERRLTRDAHFAAMTGQPVALRLVRPDENGQREFSGILAGYENGEITLRLTDGADRIFKKADAAWVKQQYNEGAER